MYLHWAGRSRLCTGDAECVWCRHDNPAVADTRTMWYAPAQLWSLGLNGPGKHGWKSIVAQITLDAWRVLRGRELRGLIVEFKRAVGRANNPVQVKIVDRPGKDEPPAAFDIVPILLGLWGVKPTASPAAPDVLPMRRARKAGEA